MSNVTEILDQVITDAEVKGVAHHYTEDKVITGKYVTIDGQNLLNFGSCSYLGLETDDRLKQGVIDAVTQYGTQFSSSRTYLSLGLYKNLESSLGKIFNKPLLVTASTTLGHLATLPVIIGDNDAVILDLQVHSSIQMTTQMLKARKIPTYVIRHNCMASLEKKIKHLNNKHDKVWYFADGVYSMYGDFAPFNQLESLLDKYKKFHLYIDDAHGMGWTGKNGAGVVRAHMKHHDKMVLAVSLNKSFGAAGGCIVFPNNEMQQKVRNCGATYIFCGPIQPPMLGAACVSAQLHLSEEINIRQNNLKGLIDYTNNRLNELNLPQFMQTDSPLFFIATGLPKTTYKIVRKMKDAGFYLNSAAFPAVPMKKSGIRFMVNGNLSMKNIDAMLSELQVSYLQSIIEDGSSCQEVSSVFNIPEFSIDMSSAKQSDNVKYLNTENTIVNHFRQKDEKTISLAKSVAIKKNFLHTEMHQTINDIKSGDWNNIFAGVGNLNYDIVKMVEQLFSGHELPENNWDFYYFTVKDSSGHVVLKTFYTCVLAKDDMFSPATVSEKVEVIRKEDPYAMTSKQLMTGSMLTKGEHVFIDKSHADWKSALAMLIDQMQITMNEVGATKMMLRDFFGEEDKELENIMLELGLINYKLPNNCVLDNILWKDREEYLNHLGHKNRYKLRKEVLDFEQYFIVDNIKPKAPECIDQYYKLYSSVYDQAFELNVFKLPKSYFSAMCADPSCDIVNLYLRAEAIDGATEPKLVGVMFSHINHDVYNAMIVGLDYNYVRDFNTYKQIMFQTLMRAKQVNCKTVDLAFTAEVAKKKLGASIQDVRAYVQATEDFSYQELEAI